MIIPGLAATIVDSSPKAWSAFDMADQVSRQKQARQEREEAEQQEARLKKAKNNSLGKPDSFCWDKVENGQFKG